MRSGVIMAMLLMAVVATVFAQTDQQPQVEDRELKKSYLYQWTDDKGVAHITDELGKVPKKFRDKAQTLESQKRDEPDQVQPKPAVPSSHADEEDIEADKKAEWKLRMKNEKKRLADAEKRYRDLDQRRTALLESWGVAAYAPPEVRIEAERIAEEMKSVKREIDDARNRIEVIIPDEAHKAEVPPGWLRE